MGRGAEREPLLYGRTTSMENLTFVKNTSIDNAAYDEYAFYDPEGTVRPKQQDKRLGTFLGCTVPVLQNIVGIIVFLRLPWAIGQVGLIGVIVFFCVGNLMSNMTVLSLSALVTNGRTQAGGIYFIVSRTLGPAFGGGVGFLYWGGYTVAVAFYALGLGTLCQSALLPSCSTNEGEITEGFCSVLDEKTTASVVGSAVLFVALIVSLCGASSKSTVDLIFFSVQMLSTVYALVSLMVPHDFYGVATSSGDLFNSSTAFPSKLNENLFPDFTEDKSCPNADCSYQTVAAILFPMFTGIMQGANLSPDMKDPNRSIPIGTLSAVNYAFLMYLVTAVSLAGSLPREALLRDQSVFLNSAMFSVYPVFIGVAFSASSSTLGNLYGASKVLDAMAQDEVLEILRPFKGRGFGTAPRAAVCITWMIAQGTVCFGEIDNVAPILTSIYLLAWAVLNLTCTILTALGTPNFRPRWKYFSKRTAGTGFAFALGLALFLDWKNTLVGMLLLSILTVYLLIVAPAQDWGSVSNELMFYQIRKYAVRLSGEKKHTKYWRPSILALAEAPTPGLLAFCNEIKKGGLFVLGHVVPGDPIVAHGMVEPLQRGWQHFLQATKMEALTQVASSESALSGYLLMAGMGSLGMEFNTIVLPMPGRTKAEDYRGIGQYRKAARELAETPVRRHRGVVGTLKLPDVPALTASDWCACVHNMVAMRKNVIISANYGSGTEGRNGEVLPDLQTKKFIDIWLPPDTLDPDAAKASERENLSYLLAQLGETMRMAVEKKHGVRIFQVVYSYSMDTVGQNVVMDEAASLIHEFAEACRIVPESVMVFTMAEVARRSKTYDRACGEMSRASGRNRNELVKIRKLSKMALARVWNELIQSASEDSMQLFVSLMDIGPGGKKDAAADEEYLDYLATMTERLPPVALVATGATEAIISEGL